MSDKPGYLKSTLRWIAVLPSAIIFSGLFQWIIYELVQRDLNFWGWNLALVFSSGCAGALFVICGANTAPCYRFITAISLTALYAVLWTVHLMLSLPKWTALHPVREPILFLVSMIGCVMGVISINDADMEKSRNRQR